MTVNPPFGWIGGKRKLLNEILPRLPEHKCYAEVFGGAAAVLLGKDPKTSKSEVYNDLEGELVNFFRVMKEQPEQFMIGFELELISRELFNCKLAADPASLTDVGRAVRFFYIIKCAYGGRLSRPAFRYSTSNAPSLNLTNLAEIVGPVHERLKRVYIERLDCSELIDRYDRPHTVFYVDPPYWDVSCRYTVPFNWEDQVRLADRLRSLKGKCLVSLNDHPEIRRLYEGFRMMTVNTKYSIATQFGGKQKAVSELLMANYDAPGMS